MAGGRNGKRNLKPETGYLKESGIKLPHSISRSRPTLAALTLGHLLGKESFEGGPIAQCAFVPHLGELGRCPLPLSDFLVGQSLETPGNNIAQLGFKSKQPLKTRRKYRCGEQCVGRKRAGLAPGVAAPGYRVSRHGRLKLGTTVASTREPDGLLFIEGHRVKGILAELAFRARGIFPGLGIILTGFNGFEMGAFMTLHGRDL
jgi:hypothetical protein